MAQIHFHPPAYELIEKITNSAMAGDEVSIRLIKYIRLGLQELKDQGLDNWDHFEGFRFVTKNEKGYTVSFNLVKRLEHNKPLFEFRVNHWQPDNVGYAFRMIFFSRIQNGIQNLYFINGMIKRQRSEPYFDQLIKEAKLVYETMKGD